jgi:hypothetical protein
VSAPAPHLDPRRVAVVIWAAMLVLLVMFILVVLALPPPASAVPRDLLFWIAIATSALGVGASRVVPMRVEFAHAGFRPEALAFTRAILAWLLCAAAGIFPLVCVLVGQDGRLFGIAAVDALALFTYYPSENRWAELGAGRGDAPPVPMVRR